MTHALRIGEIGPNVNRAMRRKMIPASHPLSFSFTASTNSYSVQFAHKKHTFFISTSIGEMGVSGKIFKNAGTRLILISRVTTGAIMNTIAQLLHNKLIDTS